MSRRYWEETPHTDPARWASSDVDDMCAASPPTLESSTRRETARFEAIDGTPLIRITDKPCIPFGYQSERAIPR